jgi:hypothetical protein
MTRTSELRWANYILQSHLKTVNIVSGTKPGFILTDCKVADGGWVGDALYEPIPLTEEWLVKFGFEDRIETGVCIAYHYGHNPITNDWMIELIKIHEDSFYFYKNGHFKIVFVHQLQNLYFALTGEELIVKS